MSHAADDAAARDPRLRPPWLLADVGGTNCRFALRHEDGRIERIARVATGDFEGPAAAFAHGLDAARGFAVRGIGLAIAGPVRGDRIAMVNADWQFSVAELARSLDRPVLAMNDFVAQSYSLARLEASSVTRVGPEIEARPGPRLAIGPGTGLGVGLLVPHGPVWDAVPSEGGHATAAASNDLESALIALARTRHAHVSFERLVSGPGLELLYELVAMHRGASATRIPAAEISARPSDPTCAEAMRVMVELLATAAANAVLTAGAFGGVYLVGGVLGHLGPAFDHATFRRRFEAKGRYAELMASVPTFHVVDELAVFRGVSYALERAQSGGRPGGVIMAG